jgi:hypothetical protein
MKHKDGVFQKIYILVIKYALSLFYVLQYILILPFHQRLGLFN